MPPREEYGNCPHKLENLDGLFLGGWWLKLIHAKPVRFKNDGTSF